MGPKSERSLASGAHAYDLRDIFHPARTVQLEQRLRDRLEFGDIQAQLGRDTIIPADLSNLLHLDHLSWQKVRGGTGTQRVMLGFDGDADLNADPQDSVANVIVREIQVPTGRGRRKQFKKTLSISGIGNFDPDTKPADLFATDTSDGTNRVVGLTYSLYPPYELQSGQISLGFSESKYTEEAASIPGDPDFDLWLNRLPSDSDPDAPESPLFTTWGMQRVANDMEALIFARDDEGFHLGKNPPTYRSTEGTLDVMSMLGISFHPDSTDNSVVMAYTPRMVADFFPLPKPMAFRFPATLDKFHSLPATLPSES